MSDATQVKQKVYITPLRWIGVLPVAIVGMVIATFLSNTALSFQLAYIGASPDSLFAVLNQYVVGPAIAAAAFIYYGSRTAPAYRKIVSLVLGAILSIMTTVGFMATLSIDGEVFKMFLTAVSTLLAGGYIIYSFFEHGDKFNVFEDN